MTSIRYVVTLSIFIITRQSIIHYSMNKTMNDSKIGSSIGEFVCTLENNKFIVSCVLHSFTLCTRSTGAIKNIQFLVVVITSTSKKLTYHAMLRDNTSKLCCMNNEEKRKKKKRISSSSSSSLFFDRIRQLKGFQKSWFLAWINRSLEDIVPMIIGNDNYHSNKTSIPTRYA